MNHNFYETGNTQPPKSQFLVVLLLVLLIFSGGIITALGILNIHLWNAFSPAEEEAVSLRFTEDTGSAVTQYASAAPTEVAPHPRLGFAVETLSGFLRAYYRLPQGVYIPQVPEGSLGSAAGILPGDILLAVDGKDIPDTDILNAVLRDHPAKDRVTLTLYRDGQTLTTDLILH